MEIEKLARQLRTVLNQRKSHPERVGQGVKERGREGKEGERKIQTSRNSVSTK
jgi:hypothetical protein